MLQPPYPRARLHAMVWGPSSFLAMALYRIDRYETNEHDTEQQIGYTDWIGGPTLANVKGAIVAGTTIRRAARITGEPDTWFSVPAIISLNGKKVKGWLGCDDGIYIFHPNIN